MTAQMTTNKMWRDDMLRARKEQRITQPQLARMVGVSQNVISMIESGKITTSKAVVDISDKLGISYPRYYSSDDEHRWADAGRALKKENPTLFAKYLEIVEMALPSAVKSVDRKRG